MKQLIQTIRTVGLRPMLRLFRAYRVGWKENLCGYCNTRVVQTLFNVGFFDELQEKGSVQPSAFAEAHGLDEHILQSLCDSLYAQSLLDRNGSGYTLSEKGHLLAGTARGWFDLLYGYEDMFHNLDGMLRKEITYGRGKDLYRSADYVAKGSGEIEQFLYFPMAADILSRNGCRKVLDLGCGDGTFLRKLCAQTDMEGYGIDLEPDAIEDGKKLTEAAGMAERIKLFVLDVNEVEQVPDELKQIDGATIFFVLHEVLTSGEDAAILFLQNFRKLFPGVPLVVFEVHRASPDEIRKRPGMMVHYLLFHDLSKQTLASRERWHEIFRKAGVTSVEEQYLEFAKTCIFTLR